ncbi:MAG: alpha/beta fold hydrolase [Candidatus Hydrogenedentes bacterium]|nr:alpha/beta fold hydrolase [Candidatus Hydrogenedentota bacterium]
MQIRTGNGRGKAVSRLVILCPLLLAWGCTSSRPSEEYVSFAAEDGVVLTGTLYRPEADRFPALILVHREGGDRGHWQGFVQRAQREGYGCLAFDLRGHGESGKPGGRTWRQFQPGDWLDCAKDIAAAKEAALAAGADPANVFVMGEGVGANLALRYAIRDTTIPGIVLLSPGWEYAGVSIEQAAGQLQKLPMLLMVAEGDSYAAGTASGLMAGARDVREIRTYAGAAHGADLFAASQQAMEQVLHWFGILLDPDSTPESTHDRP